MDMDNQMTHETAKTTESGSQSTNQYFINTPSTTKRQWCCCCNVVLTRSMLTRMEYWKQVSTRVSRGGRLQGAMPYRSSRRKSRTSWILARYIVYTPAMLGSGFDSVLHTATDPERLWAGARRWSWCLLWGWHSSSTSPDTSSSPHYSHTGADL